MRYMIDGTHFNITFFHKYYGYKLPNLIIYRLNCVHKCGQLQRSRINIYMI